MPTALTRKRARWLAIIILITLSIMILWGGMGWESYSQEWIGKLFRAASGGCLGWLVCHFITGLDLSEISDKDGERTEAAKTQAMYIVGFALAVAIS